MAVADNRQRFMPDPEDRLPNRSQVLAYPEAVLLVDPLEPEFQGEVCRPALFSFDYVWATVICSGDEIFITMN